MLANLIHQHAAAAAAAGDFGAVAEKLNALTIERTSAGQLIGMARVIAALGVTDAEAVLAALDRAGQIARSGRAKLEATGLDFSHPLTVGLIQQLDAARLLPVGAAAKLLALGRWQVSPLASAGLPSTTADDCRQAWLADRLQARRINAAALAAERLTTDQTDVEQAAVWARAWTEAV